MTFRDLFWSEDALGPLGPEGPVRVRWLGTAGFEIAHKQHVVLIDPYVTRTSLRSCVTSRLQSDMTAVARFTPRADAILVGHTHVDHAMDVPEIAKWTRAHVYGSHSAATLCRIGGVAEQRIHDVQVDAGQSPPVAEVGPFRIRFWPSVHGALVFGRALFLGEIDAHATLPMRCHEYRCGAVMAFEIQVAGKTIVHVGSADLDETAISASPADLLLLCAAGWKSTPRYAERVVKALRPSRVLLSHWDNFFGPMDHRAQPLRNAKVGDLAKALRGCDPRVEVGMVKVMGRVLL